MTAAPNNCASVDEQYEASLYDQWAYPPYPFPPYWPNYYHNYYYPDPKEELSNDNEQKDIPEKMPTPRVIPVPFWGYGPHYNKPKMKKTPAEECYDSGASSRSTPLPFYNPEYYYTSENETSDNGDEPNCYPYYHPYYDPYYGHYYYGYPPMFPPMYYSGMRNGELSDYYPVETSQPNQLYLESTDLNESKEVIDEKKTCLDTSCTQENQRDNKQNSLPIIRLSSIKSVKSVKDINIFEAEEDLIIEEQPGNSSDYTTEDTDDETSVYAEDEEEDEYPHQLSVILEESERTESRLRSPSITSETSTLSGKTGIEDEELNLVISSKNQQFFTDNAISDITEKKANENINNSYSSSQFDNENENQIKDNDAYMDKINDEFHTTNDLQEDNDKDSDGSEDWWGIIGKDEDDFSRPKKTVCDYEYVKPTMLVEESVNKQENIVDQNIDTSSCDNNEIKPKEVVLDTVETNKRRSVYDLDDDENVEDEETTREEKLLKMESFVEQLEQLKRDSGLWKLKKANSKSRVNCFVDMKHEEYEHGHKDNIQNKMNLSPSNEHDKKLNNSSISQCGNKKSSTDYTMYNYSGSSDIVSLKYVPNHNNINNREGSKDDSSESDNDDTSDTETSSSDDEAPRNIFQPRNSTNSPEHGVKMLSIKERIAALKESIKLKQTIITDQETKISVKQKLTTSEMLNQSQIKATSTKSSVKSFEEYSEEEEVDSGVTSDMSRHISDNEEFPELRKLTRYQRAATHSRLFKLLQEECENDEYIEEDDQINSNIEICRRNLLRLPLHKFSESESPFSSGKSSPNIGINEKLVSELVQSLLKRKKGRAFKDLPKEKLYAAAVKVLQEEIDVSDTPSDYSSFLSRNGTGHSTAAQTPQEFYNVSDEYKQYYESWNESERQNSIDLKTGLISKNFKTLSSKHIQKKIMKLLDSSESSSLIKPLDSNEVTTAS